MASLVNNIIDKLLSVAWRLLEMPMYLVVLLMLVLLVPTVVYWVKIFKKQQPVSIKTMTLVLIGTLIPMALIIDFKLKMLKTENEILSEKYMNALNATRSLASGTQIISPEIKQYLDGYMTNLKVWERQLHEAITLVIFKKEDPKATFFCAVVDLTYPGLEPKITPEYTEWKTLTSDFAKANNCILAINGEAGDGIFQNSGYGEWVGNWVADGKPITMLDTDKRPFLSLIHI